MVIIRFHNVFFVQFRIKKSLWAEGFDFSSSLVGIGNVGNKRRLFFSKVSKLLIFDEQEFF